MHTVVVIPARGGSSRIPLKNLQEVGGESLVARAIRVARSARGVDRTIVSTDDARIAAAAEAEGAEVVLRPQDLCDDATPMEAVLLHVLETLRMRGAAPEVPVLFYCTAPLTIAEDIEGVLAVLEREEADSALAVVPLGQRLWSPSGGRLETCAMIEAASVYAVRAAGFCEAKSLFFGKTAFYAIDPTRWLVVQTPADLYRARRLVGDVNISPQTHPVIYVDIDETICVNAPDRDYHKAVPIPENVAAVNRLYDRGHTIVYWTARGGRSGNNYAALTRAQLKRWGAKHHRLAMGKPSYDLLVCDKAMTHIPMFQ